MQPGFKYDLNDPDDELDRLSEDLRSTLLQARAPKLRAGLADRVLGSIREAEPQDRVAFSSSLSRSFGKFSAMAAALVFSGLLVFWGLNSPLRIGGEDEEWISALIASNLSAADIPLIANLDELLEAEVDAQLTFSWLESANP